MSKFLLFIAGILIGMVAHPRDQARAERSIPSINNGTNSCNTLTNNIKYQCLQAEAMRELSKAVLRIEKKLPNFNEF